MNYTCTWFDDELDSCLVMNCTTNYTYEQWCKVNFTSNMGDVFTNMDCDEFFAYNGTDYPDTDDDDFDPRNDTTGDWQCQESQCYFWATGYIDDCSEAFCWKYDPYEYWCQVDYMRW